MLLVVLLVFVGGGMGGFVGGGVGGDEGVGLDGEIGEGSEGHFDGTDFVLIFFFFDGTFKTGVVLLRGDW